MFPQIKHIDDLLPHIESNKQIRVKPCELTGNIIVCYMVQDEDTFSDVNLQYARECRGITFSPNGAINGRTLHKFFNLGENEACQPENLQWSQVTRIMEKRDGSMVTPIPHSIGPTVDDVRFVFKTKKTFESDEAKLAGRLASFQVPNEWIKRILFLGLTPTFEVTSPLLPIVVRYEKDELTLLHIRENVSGRYLTEEEILETNPPFAVVRNIAPQFYGDGLPQSLVSWKKLQEAQASIEGIEGWVVQFADGEMVKVKTAWYISLHHSVTFTRWRDIARTVCEDKSDDLKAAFFSVGRSLEPILTVERGIKERLEVVKQEVLALAGAGILAKKEAKEMALQHKGHPYFGLIMRVFRCQEVDWVAFYVKEFLEADWGLGVVGD